MASAYRLQSLSRNQSLLSSFSSSTCSSNRLRPSSNSSTSRPFSNTSRRCARKKPRNNLMRGMSAIRSTGVAPWIKLSVKPEDVKVPRRFELQNEPSPSEHGLWGFFNAKRTLLSTPQQDSQHGRAWSVEELRRKSFHDLHKLWWSCIKENNRILTEKYTRAQLRAGFGAYEADERIREVHKTQKAIKEVLVERWDAWEDARDLAASDPEVEVTERGTEYVSRTPEGR